MCPLAGGCDLDHRGKGGAVLDTRWTLFGRGWTFRARHGDWTPATLPHNAADIPHDCIDDRAFHTSFEYRKVFEAAPEAG